MPQFKVLDEIGDCLTALSRVAGDVIRIHALDTDDAEIGLPCDSENLINLRVRKLGIKEAIHGDHYALIFR